MCFTALGDGAWHLLYQPWDMSMLEGCPGRKESPVLHMTSLQSQVALPGSSQAPSCAWPGLAVWWGLAAAQLSTKELNLSCTPRKATSQIPVSCCSVSHGWISSLLIRHVRVSPMVWGIHSGSLLYGFLDVLQELMTNPFPQLGSKFGVLLPTQMSFFHKQLDNRIRKWDSVSLRILPHSEIWQKWIWCFKDEFGQQ